MVTDLTSGFTFDAVINEPADKPRVVSLMLLPPRGNVSPVTTGADDSCGIIGSLNGSISRFTYRKEAPADVS